MIGTTQLSRLRSEDAYNEYLRIIIITRLMTHVQLKSFTEWRIVSAGGHESAKVSSVVKFSLYQSFESCKTGEVWDYV